MITLEVGEKVYEIPEYLTISKYMDLLKKETLTDDPVKILNAYTDIPEKDIRKANKDNVNFILGHIQTHYLKHDKKLVVSTFEHKGVKYGLQKELKQLNFGGWVDLEMALAEGANKNIDTIVSILFRPIIWEKGNDYKIEDYDGDTMKQRKIDFQDLSVEIWFGCSTFFFYLAKLSLEHTQDYLVLDNLRMKATMIWRKRWMRMKKYLTLWK